MANIVRCKTPAGILRFQPFSVSDYRDILLVRADMETKTDEEQRAMLDELLNDYFPDYPKAWHPFLFLSRYTSSIGKTKIPVQFECSKCGKKKQFLFNLAIDELKTPSIDVAGVRLDFNFPDEIKADLTAMILDNIVSVTDSEKTYLWSELDEKSKSAIIDIIDYESLEQLVKQFRAFTIKVKYGCCTKHSVEYTDILDVFKILVNQDEIFIFYQVNHMLVKNNYNLESVMKMIPIERNIALSLVEKDLK